MIIKISLLRSRWAQATLCLPAASTEIADVYGALDKVVLDSIICLASRAQRRFCRTSIMWGLARIFTSGTAGTTSPMAMCLKSRSPRLQTGHRMEVSPTYELPV